MSGLWCLGATRLGTTMRGLTMDGSGGARVVWHRTVGGTFASNADYLSNKFSPHLLWDPYTGEIGQFLPANVGSYALVHKNGEMPTNTHGKYCVQIEVVDRGDTFVITDSPMLRYEEVLLPWFRFLGVPDICPAGPFPPLGESGLRSETIWAIRPGHYAHAQIPQNDHTDPGTMDIAAMFPPMQSEDDMTPEQFQALKDAIWDVRYPRQSDAHTVNLKTVQDEVAELKGIVTAMSHTLDEVIRVLASDS